MSTRITTVIPTYRRPRLLVRALRSVLAQSYGDFEVCVYDNASGDETPDVVAQLAARDPRVRYYRHARNIGMMENFAFGISHVETPLFNILSDDDFLLPGFFEDAIGALTTRPAAGFYFGGLLFFDGLGVVRAPVENWKVKGVVAPAHMFKALFPGAWVTWTSSVFRTETVRRAGGLKPQLGYGADVELLLRLAAGNSAFVSRRPSAVMDLHQGSASAADAGQQYSAARAGAIRGSVDEAIERALREGAITHDAASAMRTIMRRGSGRRLFRRAFVLRAQGHLDAAIEAARVLQAESAGLALLARLATGTGLVGSAAAAGLSLLRRVRGRARRAWLIFRYDEYTRLVERVRSELECEHSDAVPGPTRETVASLSR